MIIVETQKNLHGIVGLFPKTFVLKEIIVFALFYHVTRCYGIYIKGIITVF